MKREFKRSIKTVLVNNYNFFIFQKERKNNAYTAISHEKEQVQIYSYTHPSVHEQSHHKIKRKEIISGLKGKGRDVYNARPAETGKENRRIQKILVLFKDKKNNRKQYTKIAQICYLHLILPFQNF